MSLLKFECMTGNLAQCKALPAKPDNPQKPSGKKRLGS